MPLPVEFHGPEVLALARRVMDDACAEVRSNGGDDGRLPRLMMSVRVMAAVAAGERDAERLKNIALLAVGVSTPSQGGPTEG